MTDPQVQLSIVATVYCTGGYLAEFCSRSFAAALEAGYDPSRTEVVLVNDGCPRDGLEQALKEREKDGRVRVWIYPATSVIIWPCTWPAKKPGESAYS